MEQTLDAVDVGTLLDHGHWTLYAKMLTVLTATAVMFDGFDLQVLGFSIPSLIKEWHAARGAFAPALAVGLGGMALGGPIAGYLGDRLGRRIALIGCVLLFGLATAATVLVHGIAGLTILRLFTGMGTGGALPNACALTAELAPLRRRAAAVKLTLVCVPLGGMLGGVLAAQVLPVWGWRALFAFGGVLPIVLALIFTLGLPESPRFMARHPQQWPKLGRLLKRMGHPIAGNSSFEDRTEALNRKRASLRELFADGLGHETAGIWVAFSFSLFAIYLVFGWLPTLLTAQGLDIVSASSGLALFNLGGVFGVLIWAVLVTMLGSRGPLLAASAGCAACALAVWAAPVSSSGSHWMLMAALTATGMLANALQTGLFALATHIYPLGVRATGVAYAASIGRVGGLVSSLFGAALLTAGLSKFWPAFALAMVCVFAGLVWVRGHIPGGQH